MGAGILGPGRPGTGSQMRQFGYHLRARAEPGPGDPLGAIAKAGTAPVRAVYEYGVAPSVKGLVVMDSAGREQEILTVLAAAGCHIISFTTGRGAPQGFTFVPVVKITGNRTTWEKLQDHMDLDVSAVMDGAETLPQAGDRILKELLEVASGKLTKA